MTFNTEVAFFTILTPKFSVSALESRKGCRRGWQLSMHLLKKKEHFHFYLSICMMGGRSGDTAEWRLAPDKNKLVRLEQKRTNRMTLWKI